MKCPKCKKTSELQTKRTIVNGRSVKRERYCKKCKQRFYTTEMFDTDIETENSRFENTVAELNSKISSKEEEIKNIAGILTDFKTLLGKVKSL
jgi:transcriptional regulator NrdR family protein